MIADGYGLEDIRQAIDTVSRAYYAGNLIPNRLERISRNRVRFTLRVKDSRGPGARQSVSGRRTISACWHSHGLVIDTLLKDRSASGAIITSAKRYTASDCAWKDYNHGTEFRPAYMSSLCECRERGLLRRADAGLIPSVRVETTTC